MSNKLSLPPVPKGYVVEPLAEQDYDRGALQLLAQLTSVGDVSRSEFNEFVALQTSEMYNTIVMRNENNRVVAIATLLVEKKLIHGFSKVGHIEDVVVDCNERGNKLGLFMIRYLANMAHDYGCYKTILDCDVKNIGFYEKCGLTHKGAEMEIRL